MASPLQFAYRTQKTIGVFNAAPVYAPLSGFTKPEGNLRFCAYSPCGRFFGWATPEALNVVDTSSGQLILSLPIANVYELGFSPLGTFNPNAKKIRSLQKKVRAIEDLEMRLAGGEKLEDTQLKKIHTKISVLKELEALGGES
ncbi:hypothetical protein M440DRAFT_1390580 [Trichoderma longibrachiatum ATCC 18648]|uniref:Uncharacterized protein n=1 Tax=Trichoderma longibrachiatum ATCC 18648 TaxID=983965 RepID=A0A2T4C6S2_TRILO|nr:hypothetical protein M440DRAFT_1390580 [Trichoderma longibrachiatum ATCC 18648]